MGAPRSPLPTASTLMETGTVTPNGTATEIQANQRVKEAYLGV